MKFNAKGLDSKDVEAIAKSRVNRVENQRTTQWMIGVMVLIVAGIGVVQWTKNDLIGWLLCVVGVDGFVYYQNGLGKKSSSLKSKLMREWQVEEEKK